MTNQTFGPKSKISWQALFMLALFGMTAISIYMTNHYFEVKFNTGLGGSLCDINSYFNCDITTNSILGAVAGVPTAVFSLILCLFFLLGYIFDSRNLERTNHFLSIINLAGCVLLFLYSTFALGGLCPMCVGYYVLSLLMFFVFHKNSAHLNPHMPTLLIYTVIIAAISVPVHLHTKKKNSDLSSIGKNLISQFDALAKLGNPAERSPLIIAKADGASGESFAAAPLRLAIFSDFQCPACAALSLYLPKITAKYKGIINIEYFFYPLDPSCNSEVKADIHPMACKAAALSYCLKDKFVQVHDDIFHNQPKLSDEWLSDYAKKFNALECYQNPATMEEVKRIVGLAKTFNIKSTPTMLLNEVKIEGALPLTQFTLLMDQLVDRHGK
jgi:uncharacterized membrane protein